MMYGETRDLTGQRFGRLVVLYCAGTWYSPTTHKPGGNLWHCRCDCGNEVDVRERYLMNGGTRSCGCLRQEFYDNHPKHDITGQRFGKLVAVKDVGPIAYGNFQSRKWLCKCDCGKTTVVPLGALLSGNTKSCGCGMKGGKDEEMVGKKFGQLTVIKRAASKSGHRMWLCRCDCGNLIEVRTAELTSGRKTSCGRGKGKHNDYKGNTQG